jgi:3-hydroxy-9,10-secoandrosta-1,3,5(10)-triene-9,17-dione monooxygenase
MTTETKIPTKEELIARAEAMLPALRERSREAEENRRLQDETVQEMVEAGFPKIMQPKRFGGYELGIDVAAECIRTLGMGCGSTGWVSNLFMVHNWQLSLFSMEAQEEYWADGPDQICSTASFATKSDMQIVDGGFRLTGRWKFSSGCDFANWFIIMKPSPTCLDWMLVPRADLTIEDDWFVSGLKATGSRDLVLDDVFVPEHRCLSIMALATGNTPGGQAHGIPLARLPFAWPAIWGIPAALIGMANGMADAVKKTLDGKRALFTGELQVERVANQMKLAEALTDIHAAELVMRHRLAALMEWGEAGSAPSMPDAFASARDAAYVARLIGKVANNLSLMSGATSVYLGNPIQRYLRDINVGVTHVSLVWEEAAEAYGRAVFELPPKMPGG